MIQYTKYPTTNLHYIIYIFYYKILFSSSICAFQKMRYANFNIGRYKK